MKTVKQLDPGGCGLACVATVCGMTYEEVRRRWIELGGDVKKIEAFPAGKGLNHLELEDLIKALGGHADVRMSFGPIIRVITQPHGGAGHWIVIDGHGNVHNPA